MLNHASETSHADHRPAQPDAAPAHPHPRSEAGQHAVQDPCLASVIEALTAQPRPRRNARLSLFMALDALPPEDLAILTLFLQPFLTPKETAVLCGVNLRSVHRWKRYRHFRDWLQDTEWITRCRLGMPSPDRP